MTSTKQLWGIIYQRPDGQWRPVTQTFPTQQAARHASNAVVDPHEVVLLREWEEEA